MLGDSLTVLADERGEAAEGDPRLKVDPQRRGVDPVRRRQFRLRCQPGIQGVLVEQELSEPAAAATAGG